MTDGKLMDQSDDAARRAYWTARMDEAATFMGRLMAHPVHECGEPMVSLVEAARAARVEVAFSDRPFMPDVPRLFHLREGLVPSFLGVAREMNARGWVLKVEDGYRTLEMQRELGRQERIFTAILRKVCWECGEARPPIELLFRRLGALVAIAPKVGTHMSGSAMDVSVLSRDTGEEVDRGGPYLEMSERTPMASPFVSAQAAENRRAITDLMARHGFVTYPWEFWHYNAGDADAELLQNAGRPARYGAVHLDPTSGRVTPLADPTTRLHSESELRALMENALDS